VIGLLLATAGLLGVLPARAAPGFPAHHSAPYLQIEASDAGAMAADLRASGNKFFTLAFLIPTRRHACEPLWEDNNDPLGAFTKQVTALQKSGGNVIISFGGASESELAITCGSVSKLVSAYAKVLSTYHVNRLDLDIEGTNLDRTSANVRRDKALAQLQKARPGLRVDYTLPVDPTGMESDALALLRDAKNRRVRVNLVNIMTMDFGNGQNVLADAESAAKASASQLARLYRISTGAAYGRLGLTLIAGRNDDNEFLHQSDARALESFAARHGVQQLAFWEVDQYDRPLGYAYSKIFEQITS
jgi:chitinase